jgi:hypothetical protein
MFIPCNIINGFSLDEIPLLRFHQLLAFGVLGNTSDLGGMMKLFSLLSPVDQWVYRLLEGLHILLLGTSQWPPIASNREGYLEPLRQFDRPLRATVKSQCRLFQFVSSCWAHDT